MDNGVKIANAIVYICETCRKEVYGKYNLEHHQNGRKTANRQHTDVQIAEMDLKGTNHYGVINNSGKITIPAKKDRSASRQQSILRYANYSATSSALRPTTGGWEI